MKTEIKKIYYYAICLFAIFIFVWGGIDFISASISLTNLTPAYQLESSPEKPEVPLEEFYQKRISQDRIFDSFARIGVSLLVFIYSKRKADLLEMEKK
jgi:hypothetical protein